MGNICLSFGTCFVVWVYTLAMLHFVDKPAEGRALVATAVAAMSCTYLVGNQVLVVCSSEQLLVV